VLGCEPKTRFVALDYPRAEQDVRELSNTTGLVIAPDRLVSDLSVGEAQRVEILKVLFRGAKILVLDEPTAVLSPPEVRELWTVLRADAARAHQLQEGQPHADAQRALQQRAARELSRDQTLGHVRLLAHGAPSPGAKYRNESLPTTAATRSTMRVLREKRVFIQSM